MKWEEDKDYSRAAREKELSGRQMERKMPVEDFAPKPFMEESPEKMNLSILQSNLGNCLRIIDDEVMKGYVTGLDQLPVLGLDDSVYENLQGIQFFKISELVYQEDEFSTNKLAMVFHALAGKPCTLVLMLRSDGEKTDFCLGARPNGKNSAGTMRQMLEQTLMGFFPGSRISKYRDEDMKKDMQALKPGCISSVTCVADYKQEQDVMRNKDFIQGLEKFVYAMQGKCYTAVLIADSLEYGELMERKREYERIYTQLSPFAVMQMNFAVSDGSSSSVGSSEGKTTNTSQTKTKGSAETETEAENHTTGINVAAGISDTLTDTQTNTQSEAAGKAHTIGSSDGVNTIVTNGVNFGIHGGAFKNSKVLGGNMGINAGYNRSVAKGNSHMDSVSDSISKTLTYGFSDSRGRSQSKSRTYGLNESGSLSKGSGRSKNESDAYTSGEAFSLINTKTMTDTFGSSRGITLNAQNMTLNLAMQRIQKHLERIEECESFGMWNFAAYFLGETAAEAETAANTYKSVIAGADSGIERNAINSWSDEASVRDLMSYIQNFLHPHFLYQGFSYDEERYIAVDPSALISTNELAIHMGLPRHSVRGLPVVEHAAFAQEVISRNEPGDDRINLGAVYHLGERTETKAALDLNSLAKHTFVTGSTGSGKSNAVYHLLTESRRKKIPFLVVEPAKGEYKKVFTDVKCFGTNPLLGEILRINPFSFPEEIHVLEHIDRIGEIFNVCWPMYAAMPAVLKESIERAYTSAGWDLDLSVNAKVGGLFPTFDDVLRELDAVINSTDYSADTKGDYIGSLSTRIKSLTNGINGRIFVSDEMDLSDLFERDAIVDISRVGAMETKSLIMGLMVLKLQEYRMAKMDGMNLPLKHITVLEEAHNLLKRTSVEQSGESANLTGKSVEMLTNAIAELRTYGEGFVIVDQAPDLLDTAAIRNTNTKLAFRLPERNDREITGGSMALKEQQLCELSKLPTGVAAVFQNDWQEAVLCFLPRYELSEPVENQGRGRAVRCRKEDNDKLLHQLIKKDLKNAERKELEEKIKCANISAKVRRDLLLNLTDKNRTYEWAVADFIKKNYNLSNVFRGTQQDNWTGLHELCGIMLSNLCEEFAGFSEKERERILYFICRTLHEQYPKYQVIEELRVNYLKGRVF